MASHSSWLLRRGWLPPETEGPILPGQVWTNATLDLGWFWRRDRYFVTISGVESDVVSFSLVPGPRFQNAARLEADFRRIYRRVPEVVATGSVEPVRTMQPQLGAAMTEQEYEDVTNLTKLRMSIHIVSDCFAAREKEKAFKHEITVATIKWIGYLEEIVRYTYDDDATGVGSDDVGPG
jgi:hypothetical protein